MPSSPQKFSAKKPANTSPLFDDALPANLKYEGVLEHGGATPRLHRNTAPLSPYIIHLSREQGQQAPAPEPHLERLAQSLLTDPDLLLEDAEPEEGDDLHIDFQDLALQLRDPEHNISAPCAEKTTIAPTVSVEKPVTIPVAHESCNLNLAHIVPAVTETSPLLVSTPSAEEMCEPNEDPNTPYRENEPDHTDTGFTISEEPIVLEEEERAEVPFLAQIRVRAITAFVVLSFMVVLPLQAMKGLSGMSDREAELTDVGRSAIDNLMRGASALEADQFDVAQSDFRRASKNFQDAETALTQMNRDLAGIVSIVPKTDRTYRSVRALVDAGALLASAAEQLSLAGEAVNNNTSASLVTKLGMLKTYIESARPSVEQAQIALNDVDPDVLPEEHRDLVRSLKEQTPALEQSMGEFVEFADTLSIILGDGRKMRYLVTFQNNTELRPTGGFIGSFAELDLLNGAIDGMHIPEGGTYDLQGQLDKFVAAPEPLTLLNPRFEFHDANWFPDFATSAKKLLWFYENAGGPTVDGVIAINATMIPELLTILGPVDMPKYGRTIDAENFLFETQKIVELEYAQYDTTENREENAPKQFIGDLAPVLLERMAAADTSQLLAIADVIGDGLVEKDVQLYFESQALQSRMQELGWAGVVKQAPQDYLMVVNTNLGGGKTDTVIDQRVDLDVTIREDGSILNTVTITKEHRGLKSALFEGANNVDYLRLYVPKGSTLLNASGFEIPSPTLFETSETPLLEDADLALAVTNRFTDPASGTDIWDESGKTVFGNWMQTKPGETETVTFSYVLPFKVRGSNQDPGLLDMAKAKLGFKDLEPYTVLIQKQSGVIKRDTSVRIQFPEGSNMIWSSHDAGTDGVVTLNNERDTFLRYLLEHPIERTYDR